jgi:hypothetical protein
VKDNLIHANMLGNRKDMSTDYSDEMCRYEFVDRDRKSRERSWALMSLKIEDVV